MSDKLYPYGIDCVWLASDCQGSVGVFVTAGEGPIPMLALESNSIGVEELEGLLCEMAAVSEVRLVVSVNRPDDFIDLAARGIFVYDWADYSRTAREATHTYELVAVPISPITEQVLSTDLRFAANKVKFKSSLFGAEQSIDVCSKFACAEYHSN